MRLQNQKRKKKPISSTDQLVIGFILHEIRKEFRENVNFKQKGKVDLEARHIAFYLIRKFCYGSRLGFAKFFGYDHASLIHAEKTIGYKMEENIVFKLMVEKIDSKVLDRIEKFVYGAQARECNEL